MNADWIVLGDSHALVFGHIKRQQLLPEHRLFVCSRHGATAQGAVNPNSRSNALILFRDFLAERDRQNSRIALMLGEVDCGFVIWHYAERHGVSIRRQLRRSLTGYEEFVREELLAHTPADQILLIAAPPPTIQDDADPSTLIGFRAGLKATQRQRAKLTRIYNRSLERMAQRLGCAYADISPMVTDAQTGLVNQAFRSDDPGDHHLSTEKTAPFWVATLRKHSGVVTD